VGIQELLDRLMSVLLASGPDECGDLLHDSALKHIDHLAISSVSNCLASLCGSIQSFLKDEQGDDFT
jgi:hypothetical protein